MGFDGLCLSDDHGTTHYPYQSVRCRDAVETIQKLIQKVQVPELTSVTESTGDQAINDSHRTNTIMILKRDCAISLRQVTLSEPYPIASCGAVASSQKSRGIYRNSI